MQILELPITVFPYGTPTRLRLTRKHYFVWNAKTDTNAPIPVEHYEIIFERRTDPEGEPCYAAYDHETDTLYICYP